MGSQAALRHQVALAGVGATRQGLHPGKTAYQLGVEALKMALDDCGLQKADLHGVLGLKGGDGSGVDPLELCFDLGINPRLTGYLDYGSAGFTSQYGAAMIASGVCDVVACVYARAPKDPLQATTGSSPGERSYGFANHEGMAAMGWARHMALYGTPEETLGHIAVACRKHASMNPIAALTEPFTLEQYMAEEYVIWPLRDLDICKVTAGGAALIYTRADRARDLKQTPLFLEGAGRQQAPRRFENDEQLLCHGMQKAAQQVYDASGLSTTDVDALFVSDAISTVVLQVLENYGFCKPGEGGDFVKDGRIELGGALPVNTNGGQLSEGYLLGWLHHVELARQLRGQAGPRQVPNARVAQYCASGRFREDFVSSIYVRE
jgi:acetyl-CoA acetyltransferase